MHINRDSSTPSYMQLASHLKAAILAGNFQPTNRLPTEAELIRQSGLSRITVRRSLEMLANEGWVVRRQGLGTFVRSAINQELSSVQTLGEVFTAQGIKPRIRVVSFGPVHPPEMVRSLLHLNENEQLLLANRVYLNGEEPIVLVHTYLPLSMREHADILRSPEVPTDSTFTLWEKTGVRLKGASHVIRAAKADAEDAKALGVTVGDPVLILDRITYAEDGRPVEYNAYHYHWRRYEFSVMVPRINSKQSTASPN